MSSQPASVSSQHPPTPSRISPQSASHTELHSTESPTPPGDSDSADTKLHPSRRGRRNLLKDYYGLSEGLGVSTTNSGGAESATSSQLISEIASPTSIRAELYPRRADPIDNDSEEYHPELALNKMLKEMTMPQLIRKDNQLVEEIRELDGDMKTLVYENYSKFISATDTIRKMKSNAEEMELQISLLEKKICTVTKSAENIHSTLAPQRAKIHQLSGVHSLIKKLNFLFELPSRLSQCYKNKQYTQAVLFYVKTVRLLTHYRHVQIFKQIEDECCLIMVDVERRVREKFEAEKTSISQISENVGLLIGLGSASRMDLAKEYIQRVSAQLNKILESESSDIISLISLSKTNSISPLEKTSQLPSCNPSDRLPTDAATLTSLLEKFDRVFFSELAAFVSCFDAYFLHQQETSTTFNTLGKVRESMKLIVSSTSNADTHQQQNQAPSIFKTALFASTLNPDERKDAQAALSEFTQQIQTSYFCLIETLLQLPKDISYVSLEMYVGILKTIRTDVSQIEEPESIPNSTSIGAFDKKRSMDTLSVLKSSLNSKLDEMSVTILNMIISWVFEKVEREFTARWKAIQITSQLDVFTTVRQLTSWIKETLIVHALPILESFIRPESSQQIGSNVDVIVKRIRDTLLTFWTDLGSSMIQETFTIPRYGNSSISPSADSSTTPVVSSNVIPLHILILSRLALEWSKGSVESVFSMYSERILHAALCDDNTVKQSTSQNSPYTLHVSRGGDTSIPTISGEHDFISKAHEIADSYKITSQQLLIRYVKLHMYGITARIKKYIDGLVREVNSESPVRTVSQLWIDLFNEFKNIHGDVKKSIDEESNGELRRRSMETAKRTRTNVPSMRNSGSTMLSGTNMSNNGPTSMFMASPGSNASLSSLNRHATLSHASSGTPTTGVMGGIGLNFSGNNSSGMIRSATGMRHVPSSHLAVPSSSTQRAPERFESLLNDIDKLFEERIEYLPNIIDLNSSSAMNSIIKMTVKCFIEQIRISVFQTSAFQQIQIDLAYIRAQFWVYMTDAQILISLTETCLQNATQRCVAPQFDESFGIGQCLFTTRAT
ncbi:hypothetical protein BASA62_008742 [Batrachochytrium salamandrivorans]|nr:hypothetical protein BASA62_008742 [Batrachochytrium salamandrivorans]